MADPSPIATADELLAMRRRGLHRYELVYGELRRMTPPGAEHGWMASEFAWRLTNHVKRHALGRVLGECGFLLDRDPDLVRAPDVAFVRQNRIPEGGMPRDYWPGPPDLAVEVVSPSDSRPEVERKASQWLRHGTRMVVVVETERQRLVVHRPDEKPHILRRGDAFDAGDVVPGFEFAIAELFAE